MNASDYYAVVYKGEIYCVECGPHWVDEKNCHPIFANSEWSLYPVCCKCGEVHDYVTLIGGDNDKT